MATTHIWTHIQLFSNRTSTGSMECHVNVQTPTHIHKQTRTQTHAQHYDHPAHWWRLLTSWASSHTVNTLVVWSHQTLNPMTVGRLLWLQPTSRQVRCIVVGANVTTTICKILHNGHVIVATASGYICVQDCEKGQFRSSGPFWVYVKALLTKPLQTLTCKPKQTLKSNWDGIINNFHVSYKHSMNSKQTI